MSVFIGIKMLSLNSFLVNINLNCIFSFRQHQTNWVRCSQLLYRCCFFVDFYYFLKYFFFCYNRIYLHSNKWLSVFLKHSVFLCQYSRLGSWFGFMTLDLSAGAWLWVDLSLAPDLAWLYWFHLVWLGVR